DVEFDDLRHVVKHRSRDNARTPVQWSDVTRTAVETGFERFVDDAIDATASAFAVGNALRGSGGSPTVVDRLLSDSEAIERHVVRPELAEYRRDILAQFDAVLDAVTDEDPFDTHADRILELDRYRTALREDLPAERRAEIEADLLDRQRALGEAVAPLVESPESEFWPAVRETLSRSEAEAFVEDYFEFTEPLRTHPDAFVFDTRIDPSEVLSRLGGLLGSSLPTIRVDFTAEAERAMTRAEKQVSREALREIDRQYD
ncbi:MAG: hypothetical protein ABEI99_11415, partial [Halobaculum sp.]